VSPRGNARSALARTSASFSLGETWQKETERSERTSSQEKGTLRGGGTSIVPGARGIASPWRSNGSWMSHRVQSQSAISRNFAWKRPLLSPSRRSTIYERLPFALEHRRSSSIDEGTFGIIIRRSRTHLSQIRDKADECHGVTAIPFQPHDRVREITESAGMIRQLPAGSEETIDHLGTAQLSARGRGRAEWSAGY